MSDDTTLAAFDKAFELVTHVAELMQETLAQRGLTTPKAQVIFALHHDGPQVQRKLSEALRCTPRHVTALIDNLSEAGFVARGPHPTDRRATLVTLTQQGVEAAERMVREREKSADELLGEVPEDQLKAFIAVADRFIGGQSDE